MSGRRVDDHSFWAGSPSKDSVFPEGVKKKMETSVEGAAHIGMDYPDTSEMIKRDQEGGVKKALAHKMKPGYRN